MPPMSNLIGMPTSASRSSLEDYVINVALEEEWEVSFDELHITQMIGEGSFGCVRSALWRGTEVALKVLKDRAIDSREFYMEIKILTRLHHPNILQVLGCCTQRKPFAIVIEYMQNGSLERFVNQKSKHRLTEIQKIGVVKDVARGISYLHNRKPIGIIHRDIKPSNILLSRSFKAKIADFGISSIKSRPNEKYEHTGETGTYRYMAPEVLKSKSYSCQVDIWSFGLLVYAIFVEKPFNGCSTNEEMFTLILNDPVSNWLYLKNIQDSNIRNLICKTVVVDPDYRWDATYMVNYCNAAIKIQESKKKSKKKKKKNYSLLCCFNK